MEFFLFKLLTSNKKKEIQTESKSIIRLPRGIALEYVGVIQEMYGHHIGLQRQVVIVLGECENLKEQKAHWQ